MKVKSSIQKVSFYLCSLQVFHMEVSISLKVSIISHYIKIDIVVQLAGLLNYKCVELCLQFSQGRIHMWRFTCRGRTAWKELSPSPVPEYHFKKQNIQHAHSLKFLIKNLKAFPTSSGWPAVPNPLSLLSSQTSISAATEVQGSALC